MVYRRFVRKIRSAFIVDRIRVSTVRPYDYLYEAKCLNKQKAKRVSVFRKNYLKKFSHHPSTSPKRAVHRDGPFYPGLQIPTLGPPADRRLPSLHPSGTSTIISAILPFLIRPFQIARTIYRLPIDSATPFNHDNHFFTFIFVSFISPSLPVEANGESRFYVAKKIYIYIYIYAPPSAPSCPYFRSDAHECLRPSISTVIIVGPFVRVRPPSKNISADRDFLACPNYCVK